jgi:hypothetical protein
MGKEEFLKESVEIIEDRVFIGNFVDDLNNKISQNTWSISMEQELTNEFTVEDLASISSHIRSTHEVIV